MAEKDYQDGLIEGRINAVEHIMAKHSDRMDVHSDRLKKLERLMYIAVGMAIAVQSIPMIQALLKVLG